MKTFLFSLLLIASFNGEKMNARGAAGPASNTGGQKTAVIFAPSNSQRIEPTEFNSRVGLPNLSRQQPLKLDNPIDSVTYPQVVPSDIAASDGRTIIVFDSENPPAGFEALLQSGDAMVVDSLEEAQLVQRGERTMFDAGKTITAGVDRFPGFNNDVEHLPITTLLRGDRPISEETDLLGVDEPSIPGRRIAPMNMSDMPRQSAIPIRSPAVPPQYRLQPGQIKQGLDFSTIAHAPKIVVKFSPIPNVVALNNKREPFNIIQQTDCGKLGINDCLEKSDTLIPVAEKIITNDSKVRDTDVNYPGAIPSAFLRSTENNILKIDANTQIELAAVEEQETIVGSNGF